jgi:hypothetical protein
MKLEAPCRVETSELLAPDGLRMLQTSYGRIVANSKNYSIAKLPNQPQILRCAQKDGAFLVRISRAGRPAVG